MTEAKKVHPDYERIDKLLSELNIWGDTTDIEESRTRRDIGTILIDRIFGDDGDFDIKYGRHVNKDEIQPKQFQSTNKVEIKQIDDQELGDSYKISVTISDLNLDHRERTKLYFDGYISETDGLVEKRPTVIRKG